MNNDFDYDFDNGNEKNNDEEIVTFSFEFHFLISTTECKSIADTLKYPCLRLFGRTKLNQSICVNVLNVCPYFYVNCEEDTVDIIPEFPFGSVEVMAASGINFDSTIKTSLITRIPFYHFYDGTRKFIKIECCSESVRKKLVEYLKTCTELNYTLYEVSYS